MENFKVIILLFMAVVIFGMGLIVYLWNRRSKINKSFGLFVICVALWSFGLAMFYNTLLGPTSLFWAKSLYVIASFIPTFFLYFSWVFPTGKVSPPRFKSLLIFIPNLVLFYLFFFTDFIITGVDTMNNAKGFIYGPGHILWDLQFDLFFVWAFLNLFRKYRSSSGLIRAQLRYIVYGTLFGLILAALTNVILPWFDIFRFMWIGPELTIVWVVAIAYAILKYRLMDIRLIIARSVLYFLLIIYVAGLFTFLSFVAGELLIERTGMSSSFVPLIIAFVIVIGLEPLKRILTKYTDKIFYKGRIDYQKSLQHLSEVVAREINLEELLDSILEILTHELKLKTAVALVSDKKGKFFKPESYLNGQKAVVLSADNPIIKYLKKDKNIIVTEELGRMAEDAKTNFEKNRLSQVRKELDNLGTALCIPVIIEHELTSIMLVGPKLSGDMFTAEDIRLFEVLSPQMAAAIEKAKLYEEVQDFTKTLQQRVDKATHELKNANVHLRKLDKAKSEFLSIAAHQLRTPLTGIKGYLSMLIDGDFGALDDPQKKVMKSVFEGSERLNRLINVFLNISRIESGRLRLEKQPVILEKLVASIVYNFELEAKNKNLKLKFIKPKNKTKPIMLDQDKITDVINNLIDNAIKYTQKGKVTIQVSHEKGLVLFSITDTGFGIAQEEATELFNKFSRSQASEKINTSGSGLGLYIAKRLIEAHAGKIWVQSKGPGKGSTFKFVLPVK